MNNEKKIKQSQEYWNVKNSGKRLMYKLSPNEKGQYQTFKVNEDDFNALKSVLGYINRSQENNALNSELYFKLFILQLVGDIRENKTTIFNDFLFARISNQLSMPLPLFFKTLYDDICANQLNKLNDADFIIKDFDEIVMNAVIFKANFTLQNLTEQLTEKMLTIKDKRQ